RYGARRLLVVGILRSRLGRQDDICAAAFAGIAFDPGTAAMQLRKPAHQRETQARPRALTVITIVDLTEGLEHAVESFTRNSRAVVFDHDLEIAAARARARDRNAPAVRREFHRVRNEIDQDLLERTLVGIERRCGGIDVDDELLLSFA